MNRPPRPPQSKLLDPASLRFVMISGIAKAAGGIAIISLTPLIGLALAEMRSVLFIYESVLQLVFAYPARRSSLAPLPNIWLNLAVGLGILLQVLTLLLAPLRTLLGLVPISALAFGGVGILVIVTWAIAELFGSLGARSVGMRKTADHAHEEGNA